jgi:hypothetical protein
VKADQFQCRFERWEPPLSIVQRSGVQIISTLGSSIALFLVGKLSKRGLRLGSMLCLGKSSPIVPE